MWHIFPRGPHGNRVSKTRFLIPINKNNLEETPEHQRKTQRKKRKKEKKENQKQKAREDRDRRPRRARHDQK